MRRILRTILFLAVLCLAGCSGDDPQSVAFNQETLEVSPEKGTYPMEISANCAWTITAELLSIHIEPTYGNGNSTVHISLPENESYNELTKRITITSEDGTSSDILTVIQKENIGMDIQKIGMISEEGGTFDIPVETNDNITSVNTPDWVAFTSSRALTGYTYTFTAEPNKTGSVRTGTVSFNGKERAYRMEVKQDSYAPKKIEILDYFPASTSSERTFDLIITPDYADRSKIKVVCNKECTASVDENTLNVTFNNYGKYCLTFLGEQNNPVGTADMEYIPKKPLWHGGYKEVYLGQENFIKYIEYVSDSYILASSDNQVVAVSGNSGSSAVGCGECTVSVSYPGTDCYDELPVSVEPFTLNPRILHISNFNGNVYKISLVALVGGADDMEYHGFALVNPENNIVMMNDGETKWIDRNHLKITTDEFNIICDEDFDYVFNLLAKYRFLVQASVGGQKHERIVSVDSNHIGDFN